MELTNLLTYGIILITVGFSLVGFNNRELSEKYLFHPYSVKHNGEYYRFFTHAFLHADATHLIFNCISFLAFSEHLLKILQQLHGFQFGNLQFIGLIFFSMIASSLVSFSRHKDNYGYRSLGLSGVVSAVIFGYILFFPNASISPLLLPIPIPGWLFGLAYMAFEYYADRKQNSNIAHDAHLSGAIFGAVYIFAFNYDIVIEIFKRLLS